MSLPVDAVWLNVSPALQLFDRPLLRLLSQQYKIAHWEYQQDLDEANSLTLAIALLHEYLQSCPEPVHLVGHGTGGLVALLYTRYYPHRVRSLTLLSVGVHPAVDWQAHYYALAKFLHCSRSMILGQMVQNLFGPQPFSKVKSLIRILEQDLLHSLSPHNLFKHYMVPPGGVEVPLMICGGLEDVIIDPHHFHRWHSYFKSSDRLWLCPHGRYFFHQQHPELTASQVLDFWQPIQAEQQNDPLLMTFA